MFLFFPVLRRGSQRDKHKYKCTSFYSSPSCDGDLFLIPGMLTLRVSILPRLATGILAETDVKRVLVFLFFPVLRRGSTISCHPMRLLCFYSSPSCDGDPRPSRSRALLICFYSSPSCDGDHSPILHRLAPFRFYSSPSCDGDHVHIRHRLVCNVSILPRLATGIPVHPDTVNICKFLFFPVLRRGSIDWELEFAAVGFYSSPSCDGDPSASAASASAAFLFFPVLRRGSMARKIYPNVFRFYSSPSCDGDHSALKELSS